MWGELAFGVGANALTVALTFFGLGLPYLVSRRRKQLRFFGINPDRPNLVIYLSGVPVDLAERAAGHSRLIKGFKGTLVFKTESEAANMIAAEFSNAFSTYFPSKVKDFAKEASPRFLRVRPIISISPDIDPLSAASHLRNESTICVGSHVYNSATYHYQRELSCFFRFDEIEGELRVVTSETAKVIYEGRSKKRELAIVQRLKNNHSSEKTVIICAGTGQNATKGAAVHLLNNWEAYQRRFGDSPFGVCLAFPTQSPEAEEVPQIQVLRVLPDPAPALAEASASGE